VAANTKSAKQTQVCVRIVPLKLPKLVLFFKHILSAYSDEPGGDSDTGNDFLTVRAF
jgi:hypothetical protein